MLTRENSEKVEDVAIPSENYLFRMLYHCTIGVLQKDGERKRKHLTTRKTLENRKTVGNRFLLGYFVGRIFRETGSIREGFDSDPELKMSSVLPSAVA